MIYERSAISTVIDIYLNFGLLILLPSVQIIFSKYLEVFILPNHITNGRSNNWELTAESVNLGVLIPLVSLGLNRIITV